MDAQALVTAVQTITDDQELYDRLAAGIPALDDAGLDALWAAMKQKSDELYRVNVQRAQRMARWMLEQADAHGKPHHRALGLLALGNVYNLGLGEYRQGIDCYNEAAEIYASQGMVVAEAQSQIGKIFALANLGRMEEALAVGDRARAVLAEHGEHFLLARLVVNLAILRGRLGQDAEALALLDQAAQLYQNMGESAETNRLRVELNRSLVLRNLGRFEEAIQASQRIMAAHQRAGRTVDEARARQSLAVIYFLQGKYNETLALLEQSRDAFQADGRLRDAMLVDLFISDCLLQLRRFPEVLEKCCQARSLFSERGACYEEGQSFLNEAAAHSEMGHPQEARAAVEAARRLFLEEGNRAAVAEADLQMAAILLALEQPGESLALAAGCEAVFRELDLPVWTARACLACARASLALGEPDRAAEYAQKALEAGQTHALPDLSYPSRYLLGQIAARLGRPQESLEAFDQAIHDLELLCGRLMIEHRAGFVEDKSRVYEDAVDLCLQTGAVQRGLDYSERAKSRALLDLLAHRLDLSIRAHREADRPLVDELLALRAERDRLYRRQEGGEGFGQRGGDGALAEMGSAAAQVLALEKRITELWHRLLVRGADYARDAALWQVRTEPIQPYLEPGSLLVEYFAVRGRLVAFLVSGDGIEGLRLDADLAQVQRLMQFFLLNINTMVKSTPASRPMLVANLKGVLANLYQLLVAPFAGRLEGVERLIVVPHGPLHYLPFHALYDGKAYLLERCLFSYLPGASILRYCRETRPAASGFLSIGHSYGGRLPFTLAEAQMVSEMSCGELFLEDGATLAAFRRAAPRSRVLHLAAHGDFRPDNPLFSGVALADGWLTTLDVFNLRLDASLVTLSACQTGRSVIGGGDELLGLMRSFLAAGAASLVATLWPVEDHSTAVLMQSFYRALAAGLGKGAALRQAQLRLLHEAPEEHGHPYFWAPFYLVGDEGAL